ncbi:MAG: cytochrome C oxidase subunit IV family protein [Chloroflexi bacterium]|nr:cytochrome C oxidase subunit IV family protein [Chloroflexota bacterium]MBV9542874.1 cytochrome C oxidase subunit IV family protein [Chloroflexota bacterium]
MPEEIVPTSTYLLAGGALIGLTLLNIVLAEIDLRGFNTLVGLLIAAVQAVVNALILMHLRWSRPIARLVAVVGLLWLGILIVGTMDDALTRGWLPVPGK